METFDRTLSFKPIEGLEVSEVPDGRVIYQTARERVHFLNPTAVVVFELCGMSQTVGQIEDFLKDSYDLPEAPVTEVAQCLRSLLDEDLIRPTP
ncbi:MAG: hypothetical protein ABL879_11120 [Devosia sp.]